MKTFNNLEECIQEIKRLRVQVDALIQIANENKTSAETTLAWRELQLAKSWLGKLLGDVSKSPSPYIVTSKPEEIVPTQEVAVVEKAPEWSVLDMCNSQRAVIEKAIEDFEDLYYAPNLEQVIDFYNGSLGDGENWEEIQKINKERICLKYAYVDLVREHLQQARFWYGFEIANLRPQ